MRRLEGITISDEGTHHLYRGRPFYRRRYWSVQRFHPPGLAPAANRSGAFHINLRGEPAYRGRFDQAFGFYERLAAVMDATGWYHVRPDGSAAYDTRFAWCGNFQEGRAVAATQDRGYLHIRRDGSPAYAMVYRYAGDFREGTAVVTQQDGEMLHIRENGAPLNAARFQDLGPFHKRVAPAKDARGWTHVDRSGRPLYNSRFSAVEPFYNGRARAVEADGSIVVIDGGGRTFSRVSEPAPEPFLHASHDMVGYWKSKVLTVATLAGIFDRLPATAEQLSSHAGFDEAATRLLLSSLEERGYIRRRDGGPWEATRLGEALCSSEQRSPREVARHWDRQMGPMWERLEESLRAGRPAFDSDRPGGWFRWLERRPKEFVAYHRAMETYARIDYADLPQRVALSNARHIVDAGGGTGTMLVALLERHPGTTGSLLERPRVRGLVRAPPGVAERLKFVACDLFEPWPVRADAILLARVLHDWPDLQALALLRRAHHALDPCGRVFVLERTVPEDTAGGGILSLHLFQTNGGRERTVSEYRRLFAKAGLRLRLGPRLPSAVQVMIGRSQR